MTADMFTGFSQQTGDFFWSLAMNNDRTWFKAHRDEFESVLNRPFRALAAEVLAILQARHPDGAWQSHISRIYRDARRLFGRGPYKDHLWFTLCDGDHRSAGPMMWFELSGTGWSYGAGIWDDSPDVMQAFRARVAADPARFDAIVADIESRGPYHLWGELYKRPKGSFGPRIDPWYNRRHVSAGYEYGYGEELYSPDLTRRLADGFDALMPLYRYLTEVYADATSRRAALRALSIGAEEE